jgi:hypothetical protein
MERELLVGLLMALLSLTDIVPLKQHTLAVVFVPLRHT